MAAFMSVAPWPSSEMHWPSCSSSSPQHHQPLTQLQLAFRLVLNGQSKYLARFRKCTLPEENSWPPTPNSPQLMDLKRIMGAIMLLFSYFISHYSERSVIFDPQLPLRLRLCNTLCKVMKTKSVDLTPCINGQGQFGQCPMVRALPVIFSDGSLDPCLLATRPIVFQHLLSD